MHTTKNTTMGTSSSSDPFQRTFEQLWAGMDAAERAAFLRDPKPQLERLGVPVVSDFSDGDDAAQGKMSQALSLAALAAAASSEDIRFELHWWGIDIVMNEKLTQDIIAGLTSVTALGAAATTAAGAVGLLTGPIAVAVGSLFAAVVVAKRAELELVDAGEGVHWPISWPQWALIGSSVITGPAGITLMAAVIVHPLRN